jgi:hypothetical protein
MRGSFYRNVWILAAVLVFRLGNEWRQGQALVPRPWSARVDLASLSLVRLRSSSSR